MTTTSTLDRNGTVILPGPVSWALALNEGDLVAADQEDAEIFRLRFRSYGRRVGSAVESCGQPWRFVEELLRLPLAALGPAGTLGLSSLGPRNPFRCGDLLLVRAEAGQEEPWFTLERAAGRSPTLELEAQALYGLRVEPGFRVILPEDALWALSLSEGGSVVYRTVLNTLEGWTWAGEEPPDTLRLEVGPGGALSLPEALREYPRLRLEVNLSGQSARFRLAPEEEPMEIFGRSCGNCGFYSPLGDRGDGICCKFELRESPGGMGLFHRKLGELRARALIVGAAFSCCEFRSLEDVPGPEDPQRPFWAGFPVEE